MFSFITEISLVEYIRRRRLTLAAFEIQNSGVKIIDVALKYGYEYPVSFTRAFHAAWYSNHWHVKVVLYLKPIHECPSKFQLDVSRTYCDKVSPILLVYINDTGYICV